MEILNKTQCERVSGANANSNYEGGARNGGHTTYGGQGGGFVGTQSNGLDLGSVISNNPVQQVLSRVLSRVQAP